MMEYSSRPTLVAPKNLRFLTLGYNQVIGDLLWLRTIQDFDFCETKPPGVSDPREFKCKKGWVFQMIDGVTEVDPRFRAPHLSGALMLSVVVNDIEGASRIFDKATVRFPNDWQILMNGAYHSMQEEHDLVKASRRLHEAALNGAPKWTYSLVARLQQRTGQLEFAKATLEAASASTDDQRHRELFERRLKEVVAEIAKQQAKDQAH